MNSKYFQNFLVVLFFAAVVLSVLLAHTLIVWVAILGAFVISLVGCRLVCRKWWNGELASQIKPWKKWLIAILIAAIGSQMGWVALLI